jgi:hypothetical protein
MDERLSGPLVPKTFSAWITKKNTTASSVDRSDGGTDTPVVSANCPGHYETDRDQV